MERDMSGHDAYRKFTGKAEFEKAVNSLLGLVEGIAIDGKINDREVDLLQAWLDDHRINSGRHPFNELFPVVEKAVADGVLTEDECANILWLCKRLTSSEYFNAATADMQRLHALIAGIAADEEISVDELIGLSVWLQEHEHLKKCWPYDEIESLVTSVLADKKVDPDEHKMLMSFFGEFVSILDNKTIVNPAFLEDSNIVGLCAVRPDIAFADAVFCLTGKSSEYTCDEFKELITSLGGKAVSGISKKVNYLVVGADGNPCSAYACYGRKIEKAVELRRAGHQLVIVHESAFHDAVLDQQSTEFARS
ncbi:probable NAD-dependent DNA ligase (contains BRCT domain type II) [gamma proteobacterium HdN1]|nr:probable NAD-dependent DNA ligase (contains BRCT domain type II) [gamma proteobacterium HdN1]